MLYRNVQVDVKSMDQMSKKKKKIKRKFKKPKQTVQKQKNKILIVKLN